jgi:hypothetical protein
MEKTSHKYSSVRPEEFSNENYDCSIRAFSIALERPYAEIHAACKRHGRKDGKGTLGSTQGLVAEDYSMKVIETHELCTSSYHYRPTLAQFINEHPKGRYYLARSGHAFALIDGVVHDWAWGTGSRSRIIRAFEVTL